MGPKDMGISHAGRRKGQQPARELVFQKEISHRRNSFSDHPLRVRLQSRQGWVSDGRAIPRLGLLRCTYLLPLFRLCSHFRIPEMDLKGLLDLCLSSQRDYYFGSITWLIEHEWLVLTCDTGCDTPPPGLITKWQSWRDADFWEVCQSQWADPG